MGVQTFVPQNYPFLSEKYTIFKKSLMLVSTANMDLFFIGHEGSIMYFLNN